MKKIECPVYDYECPYFKSGYCELENPKDECDAFYGLEDDDDEE